MILALCAALAVAAAPLRVQVEPVPPAVQARPYRERVARAIPWAEGEPEATDGVLDDPIWRSAPLGPALLPLRSGARPPAMQVRVALDGHEIAVALQGRPAGWTAHVLVDPDGLRQRWWVAEVRDDGVSWTRCGFDGLSLPVERFLRQAAAPCHAVGGAGFGGAVHDGSAEVVATLDALRPVTALLSLRVDVLGPKTADGGTWGRMRGRVSVPAEAIPLMPREGWPALRVAADRSGSTGRLWVPPAIGSQPWTWQAWRRGVVVARGTVAPAPGKGVPFPVPMGGPADWVVGATASRGSPLPPAARAPAPDGTWAAVVATPVHTDRVEVVWQIAAKLRAQPVEVRASDGTLLGSASVDLPAGSGSLWIAVDPAWPDVLDVSLGDPPLGRGISVRAAPQSRPRR